MALQGEPKFFPRMPGQQADVMPASPTAIVAMFTEIVRERFRPANGLAWAWSESQTPEITEDNDGYNPRKVLIEPAFSEHAEARNYRPAIYVDKGETVMQSVAINNMAGKRLETGLTGYYALATIPIDIEVVSDKKGESATMADTVWFYMLAGRNLIQETFNLHEFTPPMLGRTLPGEKDKTEWSTHVSFNIQTHLRWFTQPVAPLLQSVVLHYRDSGDPNIDTYLLKQYLP
jgi:hypothetical protein